jgi:carboxypeptidase C (cathepsin A)
MIGMLLENGPFVFVRNKTSITLNDNAWNKKANVLYIESPGGVNWSLFRWDSARASATTATPMPQSQRTTTEP